MKSSNTRMWSTHSSHFSFFSGKRNPLKNAAICGLANTLSKYSSVTGNVRTEIDLIETY